MFALHSASHTVGHWPTFAMTICAHLEGDTEAAVKSVDSGVMLPQLRI